MTNRLPNEGNGMPQVTAREWLETLQKQFMAIARQGETDVIASYQALVTVEKTTSGQPDVSTRARVAIEATKARMHALIEGAPTVVERRRLRNVFLAATNDGSFQRLWPWG